MKNYCTECGSELKDGKCPNCNNETSYSTNGYINRQSIKAAAREKIEGNLWTLWKPMLFLVLIGLILGILSETLGEDSDAYAIIDLIITIVTIPLTAGVTYYVLNFVRGKKLDLDDVFGFYNENAWKLIGLTFLTGIFTVLWTCLLIIPGFIAALSYSMITYIFVDSTIKKPMDVIRESKRMMDGYKWNYFVFLLSFILWDLLVALTFGIAAVYVVPYQVTAQTMYYDELKKIRK